MIAHKTYTVIDNNGNFKVGISQQTGGTRISQHRHETFIDSTIVGAIVIKDRCLEKLLIDALLDKPGCLNVNRSKLNDDTSDFPKEYTDAVLKSYVEAMCDIFENADELHKKTVVISKYGKKLTVTASRLKVGVTLKKL